MRRVNEKAVRKGTLGVIYVKGPIASPMELDMRQCMNQEIDNALMNVRYEAQSAASQSEELYKGGRSIRDLVMYRQKSFFTRVTLHDSYIGEFPIDVMMSHHTRLERSVERGVSQYTVYDTVRTLERMHINGEIDLLALPSGQYITVRNHKHNITVVFALNMLVTALGAALTIVTVHSRSSFHTKPTDYVLDIR